MSETTNNIAKTKDKVIIVTRAGDYDDKVEQTISQAAVCEYNKDLSIKECLACDLWNRACNDFKRNKFHALDSILGENEDARIERGKKIMQGNLAVLKYIQNQMSDPYASFESVDGQFEVVLVLYRHLLIADNIKIPDIRNFMNAIVKDCNINGENNILYFHDKQILGETRDELIYDKKNGIDLTNEPQYQHARFYDFKERFCYIAVFGHVARPTSIFGSQILNQKFGKAETALDQLKMKEKNFDDLENMIAGIKEIIK